MNPGDRRRRAWLLGDGISRIYMLVRVASRYRGPSAPEVNSHFRPQPDDRDRRLSGSLAKRSLSPDNHRAAQAMLSTRTTAAEDLKPWEVWSRGCTDPSTIGGDLLLMRLAETVIWCERTPDSEGYRSKALRPSVFHDGPDDVVCSVGSARQRELHYEGLSASSRAPVIAPGRFMVYFPDENLCDGYAELVSKGYFRRRQLTGP